MSKFKRYARILNTSSHEVEKIIDVLARARLHLSVGRIAITASLITEAENKLSVLGKEKDDEQS